MRSVFSKIRAAEQSGSLYGALAIAGAGTAAMLYLREQNDVALRQELDAVALPRHTPATPANAEALWTGEVTTTAQGLNGPVMLRGQRRGDVHGESHARRSNERLLLVRTQFACPQQAVPSPRSALSSHAPQI